MKTKEEQRESHNNSSREYLNRKKEDSSWLEARKLWFKEYNKNYAEEHKEKLRLKRLVKYQENKQNLLWLEKERSLNKKIQRELSKNPEYRKQKNEKAKSRLKERLQDPTEKEKYDLQVKVQRHKRRVGTTTLTTKVIQQVYEENIQKYGTLTCELCFKPVKFGEDNLEHFHPVSRRHEYNGDINERKNLGVAHGTKSDEKCNQRKLNKTLQEYLSVTKV